MYVWLASCLQDSSAGGLPITSSEENCMQHRKLLCCSLAVSLFTLLFVCATCLCAQTQAGAGGWRARCQGKGGRHGAPRDRQKRGTTLRGYPIRLARPTKRCRITSENRLRSAEVLRRRKASPTPRSDLRGSHLFLWRRHRLSVSAAGGTAVGRKRRGSGVLPTSFSSPMTTAR
jgi:hypothetical protein